MVEMISISCNAGSQSLAPFPDCTVDHSLIKTVPLFFDALVQLFHNLDLVPVNVPAKSPTPHKLNQLDLDQECWAPTARWNEVCSCFNAACLLDY